MAALADWPNFPRADAPELWDFRTGLYLHGCASAGRADIAAEIAERWAWPPWRGTPYLWDENDWPRWLYQAQVMAEATPDRQPWISTFPWCSSTGDVDHLLGLTARPCGPRNGTGYDRRGDSDCWTWTGLTCAPGADGSTGPGPNERPRTRHDGQR